MSVKITSIDHKGKGLGEGFSYPFAYPGDVIDGKILNKKKKTGRMVSLLERSTDRQSAPCEHFGLCGGCSWQGIQYSAQLRHKESMIKELFGKCGPIIPSPQEYHYRNRMDYAFAFDYKIGLKAGRSIILDIYHCLLTSEKSNRIKNLAREFVLQEKLDGYPRGIMRHLVIREDPRSGNILLNLITSNSDEFPFDRFCRSMEEMVQGVVWSINHSPADRSYGEIKQIFGNDHLFQTLAGLRFQVPVQSFFQTNSGQAENLLRVIGEFAGLSGTEVVLDLYSGTGSIGLSMAKKTRSVTGIEEDPAASLLSVENSKLNGIENFSSVSGRVEEVLHNITAKPDLIVVDPPRPGLHKNAIRGLGAISARRIIYVSCNPYTQKTDIEALKEFGYKILKCQPLDMFPHTPHIENVILLTREV